MMVGEASSVSSVLYTSHHAHFIAFSDPDRYLILFTTPARALSQLLQYSLSSAGCVLSARIPGGSRPTRPYMGSRPTRPPMGSRPTGSPGGGSRPTRPSPPSGRPTGPAPTRPSGTGGGSGGSPGGGSSAEDTMVIGTYTWSQEPNGFER